MSRSHHSATVMSGSQLSANHARTSSRTDSAVITAIGSPSTSRQELEHGLGRPRDPRALASEHNGSFHQLRVLEQELHYGRTRRVGRRVETELLEPLVLTHEITGWVRDRVDDPLERGA